MQESEKIVLYYSGFNYSIETMEFPHIADFLRKVLLALPREWRAGMGTELRFLNVRIAPYALEFACELFLHLYSTDGWVSYDSFKYSFVKELALKRIWIAGNPASEALESLVSEFLVVALSISDPTPAAKYKLLLSTASRPESRPLLVAAQETVSAIPSPITKVLKRASRSFEHLVPLETAEFLKSFLQSLSHRALTTFQVTSQFVTTVVKTNPLSPGISARVIQPAKEFYDKAVEVWAAVGETLSSSVFSTVLKQRLETLWSEKLVVPALRFCEIAQEEKLNGTDDELVYFLARIHRRLSHMWKKSIIEASKEFSCMCSLDQLIY